MDLNIVAAGVDFVANGDGIAFQMTFGSTPTAIVPWSDPRAVFNFQNESAFVTSGMAMTNLMLRHSLQTKDGYGYLFASDSFNINADSVGMAVASTFTWKIYYRFVDIPLSEFVGLVQSTQQS